MISQEDSQQIALDLKSKTDRKRGESVSQEGNPECDYKYSKGNGQEEDHDASPEDDDQTCTWRREGFP